MRKRILNMGGNCEVSSGRSSIFGIRRIDFINDNHDLPSFASGFYSISKNNEKKKNKNKNRNNNSKRTSNSSSKNVGRRSPLPN